MADETKDPPKMKGFGFSPFLTSGGGDSKKARVGVPGHMRYPQNGRVLLYYTGSSFQEVLSNPLFYMYIALLVLMCAVFGAVGPDSALLSCRVPGMLAGTLNSLCVFMLTFFIGQNFGEVNTRFENVCKTNGNITRLSALAAGILPEEGARMLMRYANAIMHIYYLMLSGPLDEGKWSLLQQRGLLTDEEIKALQLQGSPAVVLYSWAIKALRSAPAVGDSRSMTESVFIQLIQPMEQQFGGARGLAAKQIAYTNYQIPSIYFHIVFLSVNTFLTCTVYETGHMFNAAINGPCFHDPKTDDVSCQALAAGMVVMSEIILIVVILGLLLTAQGLSDIYGNKAYHYDLGVDLDNLWQESQNVLKSMATPCPSMPKEVPGMQWTN